MSLRANVYCRRHFDADLLSVTPRVIFADSLSPGPQADIVVNSMLSKYATYRSDHESLRLYLSDYIAVGII